MENNNNEIEKIVTSNNDIYYVLKNSKINKSERDKAYVDNKLIHKEDGPAIEYVDGSKHWYNNGERHRLDGPAIIYSDGKSEYYENGKRHRLDGPAIENDNGTDYWFKNGLLHRDNGPALNSVKIKEWYQYGKLHRENGPAVEYYNGKKEYWIDGKKILEEIFNLEKELRKKDKLINKSNKQKIKI